MIDKTSFIERYIYYGLKRKEQDKYDTCKHNDKSWDELPCDYCCGAHSGYEAKEVSE